MDTQTTKRPDMIGNKWSVGHSLAKQTFKKGDIPWNKLPEGTLTWYERNKERAKIRQKSYRLANAEKYKQGQHAAAKRLYDEKRELVSSFKNKPCADCGGGFHSCQMDLDHVRGKKVMSIGANLKSFRLENLLKELEKCDVVCANCHRLRTHAASRNLIL